MVDWSSGIVRALGLSRAGGSSTMQQPEVRDRDLIAQAPFETPAGCAVCSGQPRDLLLTNRGQPVTLIDVAQCYINYNTENIHVAMDGGGGWRDSS